MYKERILKLKEELLSLNTLQKLKIEANVPTEIEQKEVNKGDFLFLLPIALSIVILVTSNNSIIRYGSLVGLNTLALFMYKNRNKNLPTVVNDIVPNVNTDFFPDEMFKIYDEITEKWNNEIKLIAEDEMIPFYTNDEMDIEIQLDIKSIIYDYVFFINNKSNVLQKYYLLGGNTFIEEYNALIDESFHKLNKQIEDIYLQQINKYNSL